MKIKTTIRGGGAILGSTDVVRPPYGGRGCGGGGGYPIRVQIAVA